MRIEPPAVDTCVVLKHVSWTSFQQLLEDLGDHRSRRVAYDRGTLEIMSPSRRHERIKMLLSRLLEALSEELGMEINAAGSTTLTRVDLERGLEPDTSYYVTHEAEVRGKTDIDLHEAPPPDLAIEVDITKKSLDRFGIYAALGVPEVWRFREGVIEIHQLREKKGYIQTEDSSLFPGFPVRELARFLDLEDGMGDNRRVATFRAWFRERLGGD